MDDPTKLFFQGLLACTEQLKEEAVEHLIALCQPFLADRCPSLRGVAIKKPPGLSQGEGCD